VVTVVSLFTIVVSFFVTVVVIVVVVVVVCAKPVPATAAIIAVSNKRFIYNSVLVLCNRFLLFLHFKNAQVYTGNS